MSDPSFYATPIKSDDPNEATNQRALDRWAQYLRSSIWPVGIIRLTGLPEAADGWLLCQGQAVNRVQYSRLFAAIGTTFGAGDGSTTFNVPDLRDAVPVGSSGTKALGSGGGSATSSLPAHTHTGPAHTHGTNLSPTSAESAGYGLTTSGFFTDRVRVNGTADSTTSSGTGLTGSTGTGGTNYPPYTAINFEIRAT